MNKYILSLLLIASSACAHSDVAPEDITLENIKACFETRMEQGTESVPEIITSLLQRIDELKHEEKISHEETEKIVEYLEEIAKENNLHIKSK